jgi:hypothetical protein
MTDDNVEAEQPVADKGDLAAAIQTLEDEICPWGSIYMRLGDEYIEAIQTIIAAARQSKTVTVTVVSAYDRKTVNTFKIDPTKKTYVRPDHSMFGYVFEPEEEQSE